MSLAKFAVNILSLNFLRTFFYNIFLLKKEKRMYDAFINKMNSYSMSIGLKNTHWINASGLQQDGNFSYSTARDITRMGAIAYLQGDINTFWSIKDISYKVIKPYLIPFYPAKIKKAISTIPYIKLGEYDIIGAKTGTGDGYNSLVCICKVSGKVICGTILEAVHEDERFKAMEELMDIVFNILRGNKERLTSIKRANKACAYLIEEKKLTCIYEQNADTKYPVMSLTKIMTFMILSKYMNQYNFDITIKPIDLDKSDVLKPWDKVQLSSLIYLISPK